MDNREVLYCAVVVVKVYMGILIPSLLRLKWHNFQNHLSSLRSKEKNNNIVFRIISIDYHWIIATYQQLQGHFDISAKVNLLRILMDPSFDPALPFHTLSWKFYERPVFCAVLHPKPWYIQMDKSLGGTKAAS